MTRYYYFQPRGGFNDSLSVIMEAIEFCIKYRRILLLDTFNATYQINWNQFVDFKHPCIITDQDEIRRICSQPHTVAPSFFANKLLDIVDGRIKFTFNT